MIRSDSMSLEYSVTRFQVNQIITMQSINLSTGWKFWSFTIEYHHQFLFPVFYLDKRELMHMDKDECS